MNKITPFILILILLSSFTSATCYVEATNDITRDDSSYIAPHALPKADIFYTPFNAYRTYCSAMSCPVATKIIQIQKTPVRIEKPKIVVVHCPYPYTQLTVQRTPIPLRPTPPVFLK
ncbi:MAG: hypothetical protein KKD18_01315 [Nanoarchaeota archaeon]|nr:hypothetical protein [Nanoarchaeota archaeon]MBU0977033.1 hypothetical protein [Nanoarchaeota archaeon]